MYKGASESSHYLKRAANHSTKGSRKGYADIGQVDEKEFLECPKVVKSRMVILINAHLREQKSIEKKITPGDAQPGWLREFRNRKSAKSYIGPHKELARRYFDLERMILGMRTKIKEINNKCGLPGGLL